MDNAGQRKSGEFPASNVVSTEETMGTSGPSARGKGKRFSKRV